MTWLILDGLKLLKEISTSTASVSMKWIDNFLVSSFFSRKDRIGDSGIGLAGANETLVQTSINKKIKVNPELVNLEKFFIFSNLWFIEGLLF